MKVNTIFGKRTLKLINDERINVRVASKKAVEFCDSTSKDICLNRDYAHCGTYAYDKCTSQDYAACQEGAEDTCSIDRDACIGAGSNDY